MTERKEFKLPDVGEGLTEADIVAWHVKPGDQVEVNQIIVEIETAKAVVELPSPWDGTVATLLAAEGQTVDVGVPIIAVDVGDPAGTVAGSAQENTDYPERTVVPAEATGQPERQAVLVGYGVKAASTTRRPRKAATAALPAVPAVPAARRARRARDPRGPGTGQAAGAQAGEGPGHQPGRAGGHWARRLDHQGRRAAGSQWYHGSFGRKWVGRKWELAGHPGRGPAPRRRGAHCG